MTKQEKQARFEARYAAVAATLPGYAVAVARDKAIDAAHASKYPLRELTADELAHREALAGSDDGWGDYCSPRAACEV